MNGEDYGSRVPIVDMRHLRAYLIAGRAILTVQDAAGHTTMTCRSLDGRYGEGSHLHLYRSGGRTRAGRRLGMVLPRGQDAVWWEPAATFAIGVESFPHVRRVEAALGHGMGTTGAFRWWRHSYCAFCGRRLTVPLSVEHGVGPECERQHGDLWTALAQGYEYGWKGTPQRQEEAP